MNKTVSSYQPGLVDSFIGYYTALDQGLVIASGFLSSDHHFAVIGSVTLVVLPKAV